MQNRVYRIYTACLLSLSSLTFLSCEKDELTKPVQVKFEFRLDREPVQTGNIVFTEGSMDLQSITFTGDRDTGEDVTFMSDFETVVSANLSTGFLDPPVTFDIPQGTYKTIRLLIDPDDIAPDIIISGQYIPFGIGAPVHVQLHMEIAGALNLVARSAEGTTNVVLRKDSPATVEIFLNPARWFAQFPAGFLESANLQDVSGVSSIVISKDFNGHIYSDLANQVETFTEAIIK